MNITQFIDNLITEISYRTAKGYPDFTKDDDISLLSTILDEWGFGDLKDTIIENLLYAINPIEINEINKSDPNDRYKTPLLNKVIKYVDDEGKEQENLLGNLMRMGKDNPGRKAIEKYLPPEGSDEREELNQELGSEKDGETKVSTDAAKAAKKKENNTDDDGDAEPNVNIFDDGKYEAPDLE